MLPLFQSFSKLLHASFSVRVSPTLMVSVVGVMINSKIGLCDTTHLNNLNFSQELTIIASAIEMGNIRTMFFKRGNLKFMACKYFKVNYKRKNKTTKHFLTSQQKNKIFFMVYLCKKFGR